MNIIEALSRRRSTRDFLPTSVPGDVIRRAIAAAARAPSGGNLQPWFVDVVAGAPLEELKALMRRRVAEAPDGETLDYDIYPKSLHSPYRERRFQLGEEMYALLGIPREDKPGRLRWFARNYQFFGAPMGLFCSIDRRMGPPQWSDLGMYLQSLMLLLQAEDIDTCPQESWSVYPQTIGRFLELLPERILFCGMAIGYRNPDHPVNQLASRRAPVEEFARFIGV